MDLDFSSLATLLGAIGTVLTGATAFLQLWSGRQRQRLVVGAAAGVFVASTVVATGGGLSIYDEYLQLKQASEQASRLANILPLFGSVDFHHHGDNCTKKVLVQQGGPAIPEAVIQYRVTQNGDLAPSDPPQHVPRPVGSHYVFYESVLKQEKCGWSNFVINPRQPVNLREARNLVFLIESANDDVLEIKLKDDSGNADLRPLVVKKGWGEYLLPLDQFPSVNLDLVQELAVAHSCDFIKRGPTKLMKQFRTEDTFRFRLISWQHQAE